jgi:hypothetical protein
MLRSMTQPLRDARSLRDVAEAERVPESEILDRSYRSARRWLRRTSALASRSSRQRRLGSSTLPSLGAASCCGGTRRRSTAFLLVADSAGDGAEYRVHEMAAVAWRHRVGAMDHLPARRARRSGTRHLCRCRRGIFRYASIVGGALRRPPVPWSDGDRPARARNAGGFARRSHRSPRAGGTGSPRGGGRIGTGRLRPADLLTLCSRSKPRSPRPSGAGV